MDTELFVIPINDLTKYMITKDGHVWSNHKHEFMSPKVVNGYYTLGLGNPRKVYTVARLVAQTFLENPEPERLIRVMHIDGNYLNDNVDNLRWATQQECVTNTDKIISHSRRVHQIKNGVIINTYNSLTEAGATVGVTRHAISKACLGINSNSAGYDWKFEDDIHEHEHADLEEAVQIYDYDNYYVYPDSRIYNTQRKAFLKPVSKKSGYQYVTLCKNSNKKNWDIHRIVADHFLDKPDECDQIDHLDMNRLNNNVDNLEWVTCSENVSRRNKVANINRESLNKEVSGTKLVEKSTNGPSQPLGKIKIRRIKITQTVVEIEQPVEDKTNVLVNDEKIEIKPKIRVIRIPAKNQGNNPENRENPQPSF